MTYGPEKRRDIARSVLPATGRSGARADLAGIKRRARRSFRQELRVLAQDDAATVVVDRYDGAPIDPRDFPDADIRSAMWRRRDGDKLGPLFRWAVATTRELPLEERLPSVARLFDDSLIGRHALGHLEHHPHFRVDHPHHRWFRGSGHRLPDRSAEIRATAIAALEHGHHAELNRWMRAHLTEKGAVRLLAGRHDVEAFTVDCARTPAWLAAVTSFRP